MSFPLLLGVVLVLGLALLATLARRSELMRMEKSLKRREKAVRHGGAKAKLQHPVVDLTRCLGCGTCVKSCPEDGVLELVHGQAMVVAGARCIGHGHCEAECPVSAMTITLANLETRKDVPVLNDELESVGSPGLFLAGEVTAHSLIKTAIDQGTAVGAAVARRVKQDKKPLKDELDLCIVGAGPAGLSCSLEAKRSGLHFVTIDQESGPGGTVAKYPRRKLVLTQPVNMPLAGRLKQSTYTKEELISLWEDISTRQRLPIRGGETFLGLENNENGSFVVRTKTSTYTARNVCLALGRRGSPRKLGVPGEDLPKVAYSLLDASSYQNRKILVVGGGDSAVEAALGLAEQPGNTVTLAHRGENLVRIRSANERRIKASLNERRMNLLVQAQVSSITPSAVQLEIRGKAEAATIHIPNDEVFIMAGGDPPLELLERSGVSFDPKKRQAMAPPREAGTGLIRALTIGFILALSSLLFALWHSDYYGLEASLRPAHAKHNQLRPGLGIGLWLGIASAGLIALNLLYLVRRNNYFGFKLGTLKLWMTSHVATGILAFLCATLHGAMAPRHTVGGHAYWGLFALLITGAIGRYVYAYLPRAANGRELKLTEIKGRLDRLMESWGDRQRSFGDRAREEVTSLIETRRWSGSLTIRILALFGIERSLRRTLERLSREGKAEGIPEDQIKEAMAIASQTHRMALLVSHYEDLRSILNSWRYLHRWVSLLMVLLLVIHVASALAYGAFFFSGGSAG